MTTAQELIPQIAVRLAGASPTELGDAITDVLELLGRYACAERCYTTEIYRDNTIEVSHEWLDPTFPPHRGAVGVVDADTFDYSVSLARAGEWLDIANIDDFPPAAEAEHRSFAAFNVRAVLQVPALVDGELVGILGFSAQSPREWSTIDREVVGWAAQTLGIALQRRQTERELDRANADADRARESARHMVGRFSHELRTPLHVILGYTELLQLGAVNRDDIDALAQIQFNGRRLLAMIDDLMVFDDDERGPRLVPLSPVFDDVVDAISDVAERRHLSIDVDIDDSVELWCDRGRLRQILYCQLAAIIQNSLPGTAVQYTTETSPEFVDVILDVVGPVGEPSPDVSMPLAEALLEGEAVLNVERLSGSHWSARFGLLRTAPNTGGRDHSATGARP